MDNGGFRVVEGEGSQRVLRFGVVTRLIIAVEFVNVFNEFTVKQVERNILRANSCTFAAIRTSAGYVESSDDMEKIFFKIICVSFAVYA